MMRVLAIAVMVGVMMEGVTASVHMRVESSKSAALLGDQQLGRSQATLTETHSRTS